MVDLPRRIGCRHSAEEGRHIGRWARAHLRKVDSDDSHAPRLLSQNTATGPTRHGCERQIEPSRWTRQDSLRSLRGQPGTEWRAAEQAFEGPADSFRDQRLIAFRNQRKLIPSVYHQSSRVSPASQPLTRPAVHSRQALAIFCRAAPASLAFVGLTPALRAVVPEGIPTGRFGSPRLPPRSLFLCCAAGTAPRVDRHPTSAPWLEDSGSHDRHADRSPSPLSGCQIDTSRTPGVLPLTSFVDDHSLACRVGCRARNRVFCRKHASAFFDPLFRVSSGLRARVGAGGVGWIYDPRPKMVAGNCVHPNRPTPNGCRFGVRVSVCVRDKQPSRVHRPVRDAEDRQ